MSQNARSKSESRGVISWTLWILGSAFVVYLLGFALLMLFPKVRLLAQEMGLSPAAVSWLYYPMFRLLDR
jgi:hypothetical protein